MAYNSKTKTYSFSKAGVTNPGTVTVTSTLGGRASKSVTVK
jgi:hypothetical protein